MPRVVRITPQRRRALVSTLFGLTFFASVLTVSASNVLPCPVRRDRNLHAESEGVITGEKKSRRWIQERTIPQDTCLGGRCQTP
ncbi:hypothetical protein SCLCIDRAFT_105265 [Scleroderma citrinum Foug A]|uniref:Uncharacterized protein n=1 Tax=Scleroderma citrinum Foug A TaxID=1036808 RepID=A0A0C3AUU0_9AGAM|nr:hypothetical protein SCLCIDRAFT_105265 [Scleroderma citrinum Foug A]